MYLFRTDTKSIRILLWLSHFSENITLNYRGKWFPGQQPIWDIYHFGGSLRKCFKWRILHIIFRQNKPNSSFRIYKASIKSKWIGLVWIPVVIYGGRWSHQLFTAGPKPFLGFLALPFSMVRIQLKVPYITTVYRFYKGLW